MRRWFVRLFTHDVGRKLLALLFALVLFDVLDKKVQATDRLTVSVVYVDELFLDRAPETDDPGSKLVVVERGRGPKPLVVRSQKEAPDRVTFVLRATKEAIERARSHRYTFVLRLSKEGVIEPESAELEGVDRLRDELGPGAQVVLEPVQWIVETEETTDPILLERDDLVLRGSPAPGFDRRLHTATFQPTRVRLVGPRSAVDKAMRMRSFLFEPLDLDKEKPSSEVVKSIGLHPEGPKELRLEDENGQPLTAVRVTVKFDRHIVPVEGEEGTFELPVHVICNEEVLRARDAQKSDGWRLELTKAQAGVLKLRLQILAPEIFAAAPVLAKLALAKDKVELLVRAQDAAGVSDRTTLPVSIQKLEDFPPDLDVVFADLSKHAEVEVAWVRMTPAGEPKESKEVPKNGDKSGNGGD
jgi:hypothetical protein